MTANFSFTYTLLALVKVLRRTSALFGLLVLAQLLLEPLSGFGLDDVVPYAISACILLILGNAVYRLVERDSMVLLTPMPIFLAWSTAIFGLGPLYQWLAPAYAERPNYKIFSSDPACYNKVALLVSVGLFFTTLVCSFILSALLRRLARQSLSPQLLSDSAKYFYPFIFSRLNPSKFLGIGYGILIFSILYRATNILIGNPLAILGFLSVAGKAGLAAIFVLSFSANKKGSLHLFVAFFFSIFEGIIGLSAGMRSEALLPFFALALGSYVGSRSLKMLAIGIAGLVISLVLLTPIVTQIRVVTWYGNQVGGSFAAIAQAGDYAKENTDNEAALFSVWRRLDYSPWQEVMMNQYDTGRPASTYDYILWNFVPRFLYPAKPSLDIGTDIGYSIQGVEGASSFSGTVYGEMYWNGGWLFVILSSATYGTLLALISVASLWLFAQNSWPALVLNIFAIFYGFNVDKSFSVDVTGEAVIFFSFLAFYRFTAPLLGIKILSLSSLSKK